MRPNNFHIAREILLTADLMNTINGGMSRPATSLERLENNYVFKARVPGVDPENLVVEIKNNSLFLFHKVSVHNNNLYKGSDFFPFSIGLLVIPYDVDIKSIVAEFSNDELQVIMPFNEFSDGYFKRVVIGK